MEEDAAIREGGGEGEGGEGVPLTAETIRRRRISFSQRKKKKRCKLLRGKTSRGFKQKIWKAEESDVCDVYHN